MKQLFIPILLSTLIWSCTETQSNGTLQERAIDAQNSDSTATQTPGTLTNASLHKALGEKIKLAAEYCTQNSLSLKYTVLVDMSIHSGKNRLFVIDLKNDSILLAALCSHGCCDSEWGQDNTSETPVFSNVAESHCSSIGKYKIGKRGYSSWGINVNYKLHGLELSNSNAFSRLIVLHSWDMVAEQEIFPAGTPEGWGCPAISNKNMEYLDKLIQSAEEPILLWIYK